MNDDEEPSIALPIKKPMNSAPQPSPAAIAGNRTNRTTDPDRDRGLPPPEISA